MTTTAKIAAKGCNGTSITEDLAKTLHDNLGRTFTAVVEIRSESRGENLKGDATVNLAIQTIEVIPEEVGAAEHVREVAEAAWRNRKLAEDGPSLPFEGSGNERTVVDVMAAGAAHKPHPFLPVDASIDNGICDVCGAIEAVPVHSQQDTLPDGEDDEDNEEEGKKPIEGVDRAGVPLDADQDGRIDVTEPEEPADGWEYPAPEGATVTEIRTVPDPFASPA